MNLEIDNLNLFSDQIFHRNPNLKKANATALVSEEDYKKYIREMIRCAQDPIYFANNYYLIVSPGKGKHVIKCYPKQEELLKMFVDETRIIVLASRQTFKSTTYCIYCLWTCCFNEDKKIIILANKEDSALEFIARISLAYEFLPSWLKPGIKDWNKGKLTFSNGCSVEACACSESNVRSKSGNILVFDEFAFIRPNIVNEVWKSAYPIVSSSKGTKVFLVSTANGKGNLFYEMYNRAVLGNDIDGWKSFRVDWWEVEGRDEEWKKKQIASLNYDIVAFNQEFGNEFIGSTYTLIDSNKLLAYTKRFSERKKEKIINNNILKIDNSEINIYHDPIKSHQYVLGGDIADGIGLDYTCLKVFDITHPLKIQECACFYDNKTSPMEAAYLISKLAIMYNNCQVMLETNDVGKTALSFLTKIYQYENIVRIGGKDLGILSNNSVKKNACLFFKRIMEEPQINIEFNHGIFFEEIEYFEKEERAQTFTYRAVRGKKDDTVMCVIWALFILHEDNIEYYYDPEYMTLGIYNYPIKLKSLEFYDEALDNQTDDKQKKIEELEKIHNTIKNFNLKDDSSINNYMKSSFVDETDENSEVTFIGLFDG